MLNDKTINIGMPSLIELDTIEENTELCKELGFNFIELNMNFPYNMIDKIDPSYLRNLAMKNNIEFTMHMPDDADTASFYDEVKKGYLKLFIDTIKWARESNVKLLNMHIAKGAYMTLPDKKVYINEKYSDEYINSFLNSMKVISEAAKKNEIIVCIENSSNFGLNYVQKILEESFLLDNIFLTWDVGHDYSSNYSDKKTILNYKNKIRHMHLHDASRNKDHLALNEGELNIIEHINFASNHKLSMLVEVKSKEALIKSVQWLNKRLT